MAKKLIKNGARFNALLKANLGAIGLHNKRIDVEKEFGKEVADLVEGLTDISKPEDGNRAKRKAIDRDHTAGSSKEVQTIKVFDLIHNTESIKEHDPKFWEVYKLEKQDLLNVMTKVDPEIKQLAWESIKD